ncbi:flagellar transcriptional regulator FlhD [uncultured Thiocystis sp.]|uniref:flagellar transcriptional regulator FlhD n=1 Tax=uncultured Thiocystis sp. TaxID=1202134 RepID=UPI0025E51273|nr:flagellar transcriptional regulator FlhD [uncultured Thiocystis sp.]
MKRAQLLSQAGGPTGRRPPGCGDDIVTLNLTWLLTARALARTDAGQAALVYGLDQELMAVLCDASLEALRELAQSGLMLFRPRFRLRWLHVRTRNAGPSAVGLALQAILLAAEELAS